MITTDQAHVDTLRRVMLARRGEENAITIAQIGSILGHGSRRETEVFLQLYIGELGFAVVASSAGYFRPSDASEINHYAASIRSRIKCLAIRSRSMIRAAQAEGWVREGKRFVNRPIQQSLF